MKAEREAWRSAVFSEAVIATALAAVRPTSCTVYDCRWHKYVEWCQARTVDPLRVPPTRDLNFFQSLVDAGLVFSTVKGYVMAVSKRHEIVNVGCTRCRLSQTLVVHTWVRGRSITTPRPRKTVPVVIGDCVVGAQETSFLC